MTKCAFKTAKAVFIIGAYAVSIGCFVCLPACDRATGEGPSTDGGTSSDVAVGLDASADVQPDLNCTISAQGLPSDLFCTGLYTAPLFTDTAADVHAYTPGVVLWSDGAEKRRYLYLPPGTQIDTSNLDAWKFPVGTKAWKEFRLDGARVETRLLWKRSEAVWESGTFIWNASGTSATLNSSKQPVILPSGYEIPTEKDCGKCHHGGSDKLLGVEAVALALPLAQGMTLGALAAAGRLSHPPADTSIALPIDEFGKPVQAIGYLHANCGMACHSSRGLGEETQLVLRLRADQYWKRQSPDGGVGDAMSTDAATAVGQATALTVVATDTYGATFKKPPTTASVAQAFPEALRVVPGAHEKSLIWLLAHARGKYQMPPLVSHKVDEAGMQNLAEWIDGLSN